jgi:hypothetical protein
MSTFDKMKHFEQKFAESMAEGFWTPEDPLNQDERHRLEHLQRELEEFKREIDDQSK